MADEPAAAPADEPRGKRIRKKTQEVYKVDSPAKVKKDDSVKPGAGLELGSIENVEYQLGKNNAGSLELTNAAHFLFGAPGKSLERKKRIRQFSGFPGGLEKKEKEMKEKWLDKKTMPILKKLAEVFDVPAAGLTKADLMAALIEFGLKPSKSGAPSIREQNAEKKKAKADENAKKKEKAEKKKATAASKKAKAEKAKAKKKKPAASPKKKPSAASKPKAPKKRKKVSNVDTSGVRAARGARFFFAKTVLDDVKKDNADASKAEQLAAIKKLYAELSKKEQGKFVKLADKDQTRHEKAVDALEDYAEYAEEYEEEEEEDDEEEEEGSEFEPEDDDDDDEGEDDDDADGPAKKKAKVEEEESSDEEPVAEGEFPTDKQIRKRVMRIVREADLSVMTKKTVRADVASHFGVNLDDKKEVIKAATQEAIEKL